ncbi:hypothetical protein LIER_29177 [Lithospermum erythrorhizon]|uniref:Uncharacterized protein n=1 Tax=Lithospermum erythrorhizon TaxID=34254 RepID=A0AAV3RIQ4_LITER
MRKAERGKFEEDVHSAARSAWSGHMQVVDYLCKNKADAGAAAMDDMGAIHFAAQKGHLEIVRILLASGVSVKSSTRKGMTALHFAAQGSHLELVKYLVKKGSNAKARNKAAKTPADLANNEEVRSILISSSSKEKDESKTKLPSEDQENPTDKGGAHSDGGHESAKTKNDEEGESVKRKGDGEQPENKPGTKKAKIDLNHLLCADDAQDEDENL